LQVVIRLLPVASQKEYYKRTRWVAYQVDFARQRRAQGMERNASLLEAGPIRFRPIIMTALSTVFGVLPLALGIGEV